MYVYVLYIFKDIHTYFWAAPCRLRTPADKPINHQSCIFLIGITIATVVLHRNNKTHDHGHHIFPHTYISFKNLANLLLDLC